MKPQKPTTLSSYRRINKIDVHNFRADIKQTSLFRNCGQMDLDSLVSVYKDEPPTLLDKHAPLVYRKSKSIRSEHRQNNETRAALSRMPAAERKLNKSHDDIDRSHYFALRERYRKLADTTSSSYYCDIIEQSSDQKQLYRTVHGIMHKDRQNPLPDADSPAALANNFNEYFKSKIDNIRATFECNDLDPFTFDCPFQGTPLCNFQELSMDDIRKIIMKSALKSCNTDPIPTCSLKNCIDELLPIITMIVNLSISTAIFPAHFKEAIVHSY